MTRALVHHKNWGEEHWIVNTEYCGKKLILNPGHKCSLHHHKKKDETFYLLSGHLIMEIPNHYYLMIPGDIIHIQPEINHRFWGLEPSEILEISTHHEESDSYRLEPSGTFHAPDIKFELEPLPR